MQPKLKFEPMDPSGKELLFDLLIAEEEKEKELVEVRKRLDTAGKDELNRLAGILWNEIQRIYWDLNKEGHRDFWLWDMPSVSSDCRHVSRVSPETINVAVARDYDDDDDYFSWFPVPTEVFYDMEVHDRFLEELKEQMLKKSALSAEVARRKKLTEIEALQARIDELKKENK